MEFAPSPRAQVTRAAGQNGERRVGDHGVAELNPQCGNLCPSPRSDIKIETVSWIDFRSLIWEHDVDVPNTGHSGHRSIASDDSPSLIGERLLEPSTEHLHGEEAIVRHPVNHPAKFVHVGVEHDLRA